MKAPFLSLLLLFAPLALAQNEQKSHEANVTKPAAEQIFEEILAKYQDMPYEQLRDEAQPRTYLERLSFDPNTAEHFPLIADKLKLNAAELDIYKRNGFVAVDYAQRFSFGSMYYSIYTLDLPVLITTDSILHAMHRSYDDVLKEIESTLFTYTVGETLAACHEELGRGAAANNNRTLADNYRDVDLYLTIARNLLAGAGEPPREMARIRFVLPNGEDDPEMASFAEEINKLEPARPVGVLASMSGEQTNEPDAKGQTKTELVVESMLGQKDQAIEILQSISRLELPPLDAPPTKIYGGSRRIDYSQFRPRGHYTKSFSLQRYFRTMMWLGRADCGFNILPPHPLSGISADSDRELRNAVLLAELFQSTGGVPRLQSMSRIIDFLVGKSDNLSLFALLKLMEDQQINSVADTLPRGKRKSLVGAIASGQYAQQQIRSQIVLSNPWDTYKVPPPALFQLFGQRFVIDSFVLSKVVFDSILFEGRKMRRMMPSGLDVLAALGNDETVPLLADELQLYQYSANLKACREYVNAYKPSFWNENLYNIWLDSLRLLDEDMSGHENYPEAMRTKAWQMKQLQAQMGSWAELRHDTVLYAKQSYTGGPCCEYPTGYVEPYPRFYASVKYFAQEAGRRIKAADYSSPDESRTKTLERSKKKQVAFFEKMADVLTKLEMLAEKGLAAQPFSSEDTRWLKKTIDRRGGGSGPPRYDGWYCDLYYGGGKAGAEWEPTIADVHTDPQSRTVLEVGVGDANFCVIAIDNGDDHMAFVGPTYSFYEFRQPASGRLTDEQWRTKIYRGELPPRPAWTATFAAPTAKRQLKLPRPKPDPQVQRILDARKNVPSSR